MKVFKLIARVVEIVCALLMIAMTVITFIQIVKRYIFNGAYYWAEASVLLSMLWMAFLGSVVAIARGGHTRIDFAINLLPPFAKRVVETIGDVVCAAAVGMLAYHSLAVIKVTSRQISLELGVPKSIYTCAVLVGGIVMGVFFLASAVNRWTPTGNEEARGQ